MAGHCDTHVFVRAPLDVTWEVANRRDGRHEIVDEDPGRHSIVYRVTTPPDLNGCRWSYLAERISDPARRVAYARRWGNPHFRYSYAFWQYREVEGGSEIRCVTDFELRPDAPVDDRQMAEIIRQGTEATLRETAAAVEATLVPPGTPRRAGSGALRW
jgi:aromatase